MYLLHFFKLGNILNKQSFPRARQEKGVMKTAVSPDKHEPLKRRKEYESNLLHWQRKRSITITERDDGFDFTFEIRKKETT